MRAILRRGRLFGRNHVKSPSWLINQSAKQTKAAASSRGLCLYCPEFADEVDNASMRLPLATTATYGCGGRRSLPGPSAVRSIVLSAVVITDTERGRNGTA